MPEDIKWETVTEDELQGMTADFQFNAELETLECMLKVSSLIHKGLIPGLTKTQEAVKASVKELCAFFYAFVDCK